LQIELEDLIKERDIWRESFEKVERQAKLINDENY
jgi:hypothetical protein